MTHGVSIESVSKTYLYRQTYWAQRLHAIKGQFMPPGEWNLGIFADS
jgi:hypothetical protein